MRSHPHFTLVPSALPEHIDAQVVRELLKKPIRLRSGGDGAFYAGPENRFHVTDESRWERRPKGERYDVVDRAVEQSGCAGDQRHRVAQVGTQREAAEVISRILEAELAQGAVKKPLDTGTTRRGRYGTHLADMRDRNEITTEEMFRRLDAWDEKNCAEFRPKEFVRMGEQRERIMAALAPTPDEIRMEGATAARGWHQLDACPYPKGSREAALWTEGFWKYQSEHPRGGKKR